MGEETVISFVLGCANVLGSNCDCEEGMGGLDEAESNNSSLRSKSSLLDADVDPSRLIRNLDVVGKPKRVSEVLLEERAWLWNSEEAEAGKFNSCDIRRPFDSGTDSESRREARRFCTCNGS